MKKTIMSLLLVSVLAFGGVYQDVTTTDQVASCA